jgi:CRISPR-associated protein Csx10
MIEVRVVAEEPLSVGQSPEAGNVVDSYAFVPGAVLRGALAALWFRENGGAPAPAGLLRDEFVTLFEGDVCFGPLMAEGSCVAPMSVVHCKYSPEPACSDWVFDESAGETPGDTCSCGGSSDHYKGQVIEASRVKVTRTALNDEETVEKSQLFARRAVPAGTVLRGLVTGDHPWLYQCDGKVVWLGGRRTVGGRARVHVERSSVVPPAVRTEDGLVSVRLLSPGIFVDDATRPTTEFPLVEIARRLECDCVVLVRQWRRPVRVGGWHMASGLPKPQDIALEAGSTALLRPSRTVTASELSALQASGLGLRRREGFGVITVNPPPWRPPTRAPVGSAAASPAVELFERLQPVSTDDNLRSWLVDQLKQHAVAVEAGRPAEGLAALEQRRMRNLDRDQRQALTLALTQVDTGVIQGLIALLDDPGEWQ